MGLIALGAGTLLNRARRIQVEEDLYLVPHELPEVGDFVNHSCSPNAGPVATALATRPSSAERWWEAGRRGGVPGISAEVAVAEQYQGQDACHGGAGHGASEDGVQLAEEGAGGGIVIG